MRPVVLITRIWPTADRPGLGSFVRERVRGVPGMVVARPRSQEVPWPLLYAELLVRALGVGGLRGVEAHVLVPTGLVGWLVARLRRVPLVVYAHGGDVRDWPQRSWPWRWATRFVVHHADRVVTNSEDSAAWIRLAGVQPVVAPPGVDLSRFTPAPRPASRRVLYLGGKNPRKGYDVAAQLADTLAGPWLREVGQAEVAALIREHDVVLVPSVQEPFGIVAVEAIACGRWVVAASVGGLRDIVIDGVNGTLVADGDFAAALARVPEYDPATVAATAERFSLARWQQTLATVWDELAPPAPA
jgi:glycosyltransferase involved in cell wall biosynthesis